MKNSTHKEMHPWLFELTKDWRNDCITELGFLVDSSRNDSTSCIKSFFSFSQLLTRFYL